MVLNPLNVETCSLNSSVSLASVGFSEIILKIRFDRLLLEVSNAFLSCAMPAMEQLSGFFSETSSPFLTELLLWCCSVTLWQGAVRELELERTPLLLRSFKFT